MRIRLPCNSAVLSEARLYAIESSSHTMDYKGWEDQHNKLKRLTYGKFAQLWVYEYCRVNGIPCQKDVSGPMEPDNKDLVVCGEDMDVKASTIMPLLGQVSPGMYGKKEGFYCFVYTDESCSFVQPVGVITCVDYMAHSKEVMAGDLIPNTTIKQRFGRSRFLQKGSPIVSFFEFMEEAKAGRISQYLPKPQPIHELSDCPF